MYVCSCVLGVKIAEGDEHDGEDLSLLPTSPNISDSTVIDHKGEV